MRRSTIAELSWRGERRGRYENAATVIQVFRYRRRVKRVAAPLFDTALRLNFA
jgi:hypothetical protein